MPTAQRPSALVFYHYFHPDDVVSAVHMTELCEGLARKGWRVTAMPCNRGCRDDGLTFPPVGEWRAIEIRRVWRPSLPQSSAAGRLFNSAWMIARWSLEAFVARTPPETIIIGTDPVLSVLVACVWKWRRPEVRIAHWCFDLYPEAGIADGLLSPSGAAARMLRAIFKLAYRSCDLIVDIGCCMRDKLAVYPSAALRVTMTPWALAEPPHPLAVNVVEREAIFGKTSLALLYSGSFGRAHSRDRILRLAHLLESAGARLAFSVRGNRVSELAQSAAGMPNVSFVPFAGSGAIETRLSAADIHVVSLREEWTGTVVPSKFFGALAVGRPLIFTGSPDSAVARWIREHRVGWVVTDENVEDLAAELRAVAASREGFSAIFRHCHQVYREYFSKDRMTAQWDHELRGMLGLATLESERAKSATA